MEKLVDPIPFVSSEDIPVSASERLCRVCGKPSAGIHYDVPTCHGCKSFFRRATLNNVRYDPCVRTQDCYSNIEPGKRPRKCHRCRILKCFSVGMNSYVFPREHTEPVSVILSKTNQRATTPEESICRIIDRLLHLESQVETFRKSAYNPVDFPSLNHVLQSSSLLATGKQYGPMPGWPLSIEEYCMAQQKLHQSVEKFELKNSNFKGNIKNWLAFDLLAIIEYAKTFSFFHQLSHNDKLCLAKATTFMSYELMRVFDTYSNKYEHIRLPDCTFLHEVVSAVMNDKSMGETVSKVSEKAIGMMVREMFEKTEYLLLKAIILCNNAVTDLSSRGQKIIQQERHKYCSALFSFCNVRYGPYNGPARFGTVLSMVGVLERSQQDHRNLFLLEIVKKRVVSRTQSSPTSLAEEISNLF